jgi:riboflavin biosynthesis pyrimidine reductase
MTPLTPLPPLETLYEMEQGTGLPLPPDLATLYGKLQFPTYPGRPYVMGNVVSTLDGVVTLNLPGQAGGGPISGFDPQDHLVMGVLRAVADAVIVGAETVRAVSPDHLWTAEYIYPPLADSYRLLRASLGKEASPLNVIVTAHGEIDLERPLFQAGEVPVCLVTTPQGEQRLREHLIPPSVQVVCLPEAPPFPAQAIIQAVCRVRDCTLILIEGGPRVLGNVLAAHLLDELFLTLAPQIAGRDRQQERPGLVSDQLFAPESPLWGTLVNIKRGGSHLFLRYAFTTKENIR